MKDLNEKLNIYSEEVKDVLSKPPKSIFRWGNTILVAFIFVIIFLSWLIKYPEIVSAQMILTTEIPPQKEYARTSGKIDSLFVDNFQDVEIGTPLALIENATSYKDVIFLKSILDTLEVNQKSFSFPIDTLPLLNLGDIENEFSLFENNYIQYILNKKSKSFIIDDLASRYSLEQLNFRLQNLNNQRELNREELVFNEKDLKRTQELFSKGVVSAQEFERKKLEYLQAERSYKNMNVTISQTKESISKAKNLKKQTSIENINKEVNLFKSVLQSLNKLKTAIKEWEYKYLLQSNIKGKVSFMKVWSENQTILNGDLIFTIIPKDHSSYIGKALAPVLNSGKIQIGQNVNIRLSNYPDNEYGILKGTVMHVSLVPNNEGFYLIDIGLHEKLVTTHGKEIEFKQEMQGTAEIITEDLRLIERVFYQFKEILKQ